ncbi:ShlB/FhaC/HecB family hemolysin secretion/activation protein [Peristeroidobacter soli]|uniref:ShlB/FhaC/HecB family hemolysin secretion/activation protein n=1 Tax=Peristeroidobacter soli TaxID=2497877 RepID=UPI0013004C82|nr:ShlB/FhaC/HecB family hemolysin secretion/activation protein [Peristeroidobacter soli]
MLLVSDRALGAALFIGALQLGAAAQVSAQEADASAETASAPEERRVDVLEYRIDGNTVLSAADIETAVQPFLGPQRSVVEIQQARTALEQKYRKLGYETVAVEIPEQDVRTGVVRFNVVELSVGRLRVTGSKYYSPDLIRDRVPSLAEGKVPRYDLVAKDIATINNARDRTITPTLRAGSTPGTVDVDLEVEDHAPMHGSFEVNDRYSTQTSRLRAVASVSYANLWQRDHSLSLQVQATPEELKESFLVSASYLAPLPGTKASLVVYGMHSDSDVAAVSGIDVLGKGDIVGVRAVLPLPGAGDSFTHSVLAGLDYKNFKEDLILGADKAATPIDYIPLTLEYSMSALDGMGSTDFHTGLTWGTRGLASSNDEFARKRDEARANFMYLRADVTRTQKLPKDFLGILSFSAQLADEPLISNEGFSVGGFDSVRGYAESQVLGDSGMRASLQLETPSLSGRFGSSFNEWRVFAFGDWGKVYIENPLADVNGVQTDRIEIASYGLGTRLRMFDNYNAMLLLAKPLKDEEELDLDINDQYRAQFRIWAEF